MAFATIYKSPDVKKAPEGACSWKNKKLCVRELLNYLMFRTVFRCLPPEFPTRIFPWIHHLFSPVVRDRIFRFCWICQFKHSSDRSVPRLIDTIVASADDYAREFLYLTITQGHPELIGTHWFLYRTRRVIGLNRRACRAMVKGWRRVVAWWWLDPALWRSWCVQGPDLLTKRRGRACVRIAEFWRMVKREFLNANDSHLGLPVKELAVCKLSIPD